MKHRSWIQWPTSSSENRKPKACAEPCRRIQNRKWIGLFAIALAFFGGAVAWAQQPKKIPRIGYLGFSAASSSARIDGFRQGLRELGYVEGKNIIIEYRYAEGRLDSERALAAELARLKVDIIVTAGAGSLVPPRKQLLRSPLLCLRTPILLEAGLWPVLRDLVQISRGCPHWARIWPEKGWSCSKKSYPSSRV